MTVTLTIKQVPEALARRLRSRAAANHRSLQGELMAMLEATLQEAGRVEQTRAPYRHDTQPRANKLEQKLTMEELWQLGKKAGVASPANSARIVRKARDDRHGR